MVAKTMIQRQELPDAEFENYSRQIVLADIGYDGQVKLRNAKACITGLGGLGSVIAPKLVVEWVSDTCVLLTETSSHAQICNLREMRLNTVDPLSRDNCPVCGVRPKGSYSFSISSMT